MKKIILAIFLMATLTMGCIFTTSEHPVQTTDILVYKVYTTNDYYVSTNMGLFTTNEVLYPAFEVGKTYHVNWVQYNVGLPVIISFNYSRSENGSMTMN